MKTYKIFTAFKKKGYIPALLLACALCITCLLTFSFGMTVKELLQTQFDRRIADVMRSLNTRTQSYSFLLMGIQSTMASDPAISEDEFISYLKHFVNPAIYPGLMQVGYNGDTEYAISYQKNIPNDLLSNNTAAITKARNTGTFATSLYKNEAIIIYLPVYNAELTDKTLQGYAFVAININTMLKDIVGAQNDIGFKLDIEPYFSTEKISTNLSIFDLSRQTSYQFFDRQWPITLTLYPDNELSDHFFFLIITFLFGLACSTIVYNISWKQYNSQKKADSLERQKDEFIAIASHELKTPLTSIKALNQLLAQKLTLDNNPLYESYFRKTDSQINRMEHLINDLMDVSKIRAGKLDYDKDWFDLEAVVRSSSEEVQDVKKSHQITINGHIQHQIYGDKDRIGQVVTNLLINAIKYSPQANLVIVHMKETDTEAIISLQDFGIGINNEDQQRIFERFYRVTPDERKYKGMGIGLFISSEIIQKHGGKIWVKSTKGKGSIFYFSLPIIPVEEI